MKRCHVLTVLVLVASAGIQQSRADSPPNIVLIVADDLGYGDLGCYGAPDVKTPAIDQLARDGVRFVSFYSNGPECTPTRTALMTGRYQQRFGGLECAIGVHNVGRYDDAIRLANQHDLGLPPEEVTLPERLQSVGYTCGHFGKWHLGYEEKFHPLNQGFDAAFGCLGGNCDYFRHTEEDGWNVLFEGRELITRDGHMTDLITDAALAWYQTVKRNEKPFFLYVPYTCPHTPIQPPGSDTGALAEPDVWNGGSRADYAAMIEHMDARIGDLLAAIDDDGRHRRFIGAAAPEDQRASERKLAESPRGGRRETLVVFMSDNGGTKLARNEPYSGTKGTTYEGGIRVPCIARWPKHLPEGQVVTHPAITMDFTRSFVRIAGVPQSAEIPFDGIDILAQIENDEPIRPRTLFWRGRRGERTWQAVRDGDLKRIWRIDGDEQQSWLFDLQADPSEQHDLLAQRPEDASRLQKLIDAWATDVAPRR